MLYISLPYYKGWTVYVDGNKVEAKQFLGSIGFPVDAGEHSIRMSYFPVGAIGGLIISCITLIILSTEYKIKQPIINSD